jgi:hypothetical protein
MGRRHSIVALEHGLGCVAFECCDHNTRHWGRVGSDAERSHTTANTFVTTNFPIAIQLHEVLKDVADDILSLKEGESEKGG